MGAIALAYKTFDYSNWSAYIENSDNGWRFRHCPDNDPARAHVDTIINYWTYGLEDNQWQRWVARLNGDGDQFIHWPDGHPERSHTDNRIIYVDWRLSLQEATLQNEIRRTQFHIRGAVIVEIAARFVMTRVLLQLVAQPHGGPRPEHQNHEPLGRPSGNEIRGVDFDGRGWAHDVA